jgi:TolA-binding protein
MRRYTFRMKALFWIVLIAGAAGCAYWWRRWRQREDERERAAEQRFAAAMAQVKAEVAPVDPAQRLLFEAAGRAGEANEPALAIQLYARLISRFPDGALVAQARAAVDLQKKKLAKP